MRNGSCCGTRPRCCAAPSRDPGGPGPPGGAGRADQAPAGKAAGAPAGHAGHRPAVAPWPGHREAGRSAPHGTPQSERGVLGRAVMGVQGGSRSKRQGWTRPATLADVTAVRGAPCAFAPGVAGHAAPLPQAGRGERRCRRGTVTCATFACATSPTVDIPATKPERPANPVTPTHAIGGTKCQRGCLAYRRSLRPI